jgi:hypothetical protein
MAKNRVHELHFREIPLISCWESFGDELKFKPKEGPEILVYVYYEPSNSWGNQYHPLSSTMWRFPKMGVPQVTMVVSMHNMV